MSAQYLVYLLMQLKFIITNIINREQLLTQRIRGLKNIESIQIRFLITIGKMKILTSVK